MFEWMWGLMRAGAWWLDALHGSQISSQEAWGIMAAAMLWQQGAMQEVSVWDSEVEDAMREMAKAMEEGGSDL